ncbi:C40 family peptidase [Rhodonellum sp.]|uniref:C40 family peptidase n=1 Tax=Rhodonellum sp. TaxID=2231180 RepID=UPI0027226DFD|nr:C40 family peptidase [Rhodonellum sp.]MDO9554244.1 C40 family peptidase [Rhodonellum sp.]
MSKLKKSFSGRFSKTSKFLMMVAVGTLALIISYHSSNANLDPIEPEPIQEKSMEISAPQTKADSLVTFAMSLQGIPYQYAGKSLEGFDCSGFLYFVFNKFGIAIPAGSANQYLLGEPVDEAEMQKGDLIFFVGYEDAEDVGHSGIVISEKGEEIKFIHSSSGGDGRGVTINRLDEPHYRNRFLGLRRILF